jgi:hypothetical protein
MIMVLGIMMLLLVDVDDYSLAEKYPNISSYAYRAWNSVK